MFNGQKQKLHSLPSLKGAADNDNDIILHGVSAFDQLALSNALDLTHYFFIYYFICSFFNRSLLLPRYCTYYYQLTR